MSPYGFDVAVFSFAVGYDYRGFLCHEDVDSEICYGGIVVFIRIVGFCFLWGGVVNVGICGSMLGVGEGGSFVSRVSCVVPVIGVADG